MVDPPTFAEARGVARLPVALGMVFALIAAAAVASETADRDHRSVPTVTGIDIDLELDPAHGLIRERATLTVRGGGQVKLPFTIDPGLIVERSRIRGPGSVEHFQSGSRLEVVLEQPLDGERRIEFEITGRPRRGARDLVTERWAALGGDDRWYPRLPAVEAVASVRVTAPAGWVAVASGSPTGAGPPEAGSPWEWRASKPVRTVGVVAAPDLRLTDAALVRDRLRVAAPEDHDGASKLAEPLADPFSWLSGALAAYPFDGFNLVRVPDLPHRVRASGLLGVPTAVPAATPADGAALLAGQWFGEHLPGDGPWIEAFAGWQALTYARDRSIAMPREIEELRRRYLEMDRSRDVALSRASADTAPEIVRGKGSAAPDAVRLLAGNRRFFRAIQDLFARREPVPVSLDRLRSVFEARARESLEAPFAQWFERAGVPRFEVRLRTVPAAGGGWRADISLRQLDGEFTLPLEIDLVGAANRERVTVRVEDETSSVYYLLEFRPARIVIDPLDRVFQRPPVIVER